MAVPLYGFLEGDTLGILLLAEEDETLATLARRLQEAASLRVAEAGQLEVVYRDRILEPTLTVGGAALEPRDRFDVRRSKPSWPS